MKNLPFALLFAAALAGGLAGCATASLEPAPPPEASHVLEPKAPLAVSLPLPEADDASPALANRTVSTPIVGLEESEVLQALGRPAERLTPEIWIYWQYYPPEKAVETGGNDTLVVTFARGRVSGMKLVASDVLKKHLANRRIRSAPGQP